MSPLCIGQFRTKIVLICSSFVSFLFRQLDKAVYYKSVP
jgi:hypothetical protein